jgi:fucose 4-O-acetylase-like acetyltransferase
MEGNTRKKPRLEWLDALRGFTMIMVVANHVCNFTFVLPYQYSSSMHFLILFRMPLFFFISGFLAYKAGLAWNRQTLGSLLAKKIKVQTIPTIVFFLIGAVILGKEFGPTVMEWLEQPTKGGYWFTITLLYMFVIYYIFSYAESKLKRQSCIPILVLFVVSLAFYETCYQPQYFSWAMGFKGVRNEFVRYASLEQLFMYFPFFIFGNMVRRYWNQWQRVMDSAWFFPMLVLIAILSALDSQKWHLLKMEWAVVSLTLARFALLTIVFMYFRHYHQYFTKMTTVGRTLQYIGRRTLDIYLIHLLFLPNLPTIGTFFKTYQHNFIVDTTLSVLIALVVIGFCCVTSNILRISPFLRKWLFGR